MKARISILVLVAITSPIFSQWTKTNLSGRGAFPFLMASGENVIASETSIVLEEPNGYIYLSSSKGDTWKEIKWSLPFWAFESIGEDLLGGTEDGIFRSTDHGVSWQGSSTGMRNGESVNGLTKNVNYIFAGTNRTIYRSSNNGLSWEQARNGFLDTQVVALGCDGATLYAASNNAPYRNAAIYRSTDHGNTWVRKSSGLSSLYIFSIAVLNSRIFLATDKGVFISKNSGESWESSSSGLTVNVTHTLFTTHNTVFLGTDNGIFLSSNLGESWTDVNAGLPTYKGEVVFDAMSFTSDGTFLYVGDWDFVWRRPLVEMIDISNVEIETASESFRLLHFPNPASSTVTISFFLPRTSFAKVRIVDDLGREIAVLDSEMLPSGIYEREWNPKDQTSGIYFVRLEVNGQIETRKLILSK